MPLVTEGFVASLSEAAIRFALSHPVIGTILVGVASTGEWVARLVAVQKSPLAQEALQRVVELTRSFAGESR